MTPGWPWHILRQGQIWSLMRLYGKKVNQWIFSSPEPKAHWWAYRKGRLPSSVICPSVVHTLQTSSSQKPLGRLKPHFIWSLHGMGERKFVQTVPVSCLYMVKHKKNLFIRNQKANGLETWYAASGAQVLPSLVKWWPCVDHDLFYGKVKFDPLCFCMGKR